jgi:hypothetical protein
MARHQEGEGEGLRSRLVSLNRAERQHQPEEVDRRDNHSAFLYLYRRRI